MRNPFNYRFGLPSPFYDNEVGFFTPFSPSSLFSSGSQGIWLDPSDLSTMFSDRAGTTPVTAPGTVVGLRLDKSKGLALGAEKVSNPGPFTATTGWSPNNATVLAVSSELVLTTTSTTGFASTALTGLTAGRTYQVVFTCRKISGTGAASIDLPAIYAAQSNSTSTSQTFTFRYVATGTSGSIALNSRGGIGEYAFP